MPFQRPIVPLVLGGAVPALVRSIALLPCFDLAGSVTTLIVVVLLAIWIGFVIAIYRASVQPLRSIANLLEALHAQRFEALEASALLHKVLPRSTSLSSPSTARTSSG